LFLVIGHRPPFPGRTSRRNIKTGRSAPMRQIGPNDGFRWKIAWCGPVCLT
jgi:hypothetical protein